jgi:hypothetical protein
MTRRELLMATGAVILAAGCGGSTSEDGGGPADVTSVFLPWLNDEPGVAVLKAATLFSEAGSDGNMELPSEACAFVMGLNAKDEPVLAAVAGLSSPCRFSAESTVEALCFLSTGIGSTEPAEAREFTGALRALPEFRTAATLLKTKLSSGTLNSIVEDPDFESSMTLLIEALITTTVAPTGFNEDSPPASTRQASVPGLGSGYTVNLQREVFAGQPFFKHTNRTRRYVATLRRHFWNGFKTNALQAKSLIVPPMEALSMSNFYGIADRAAIIEDHINAGQVIGLEKIEFFVYGLGVRRLGINPPADIEAELRNTGVLELSILESVVLPFMSSVTGATYKRLQRETFIKTVWTRLPPAVINAMRDLADICMASQNLKTIYQATGRLLNAVARELAACFRVFEELYSIALGTRLFRAILRLVESPFFKIPIGIYNFAEFANFVNRSALCRLGSIEVGSTLTVCDTLGTSLLVSVEGGWWPGLYLIAPNGTALPIDLNGKYSVSSIQSSAISNTHVAWHLGGTVFLARRDRGLVGPRDSTGLVALSSNFLYYTNAVDGSALKTLYRLSIHTLQTQAVTTGNVLAVSAEGNMATFVLGDASGNPLTLTYLPDLGSSSTVDIGFANVGSRAPESVSLCFDGSNTSLSLEADALAGRTDVFLRSPSGWSGRQQTATSSGDGKFWAVRGVVVGSVPTLTSAFAGTDYDGLITLGTTPTAFLTPFLMPK